MMIYTDSEFLNSIALFFYNHLPDVLNLNLTASIVILFVICVRQFLKIAPKIFSYALWGIVLLRLLVPVSIESPMSFVPERTEFTSMVDVNEALPEMRFQTAQNRFDNERQMQTTAPGEPMVLSHSIVEPQVYLTMIWMAGMLFLSVRSILAYLGLRERVKVSVSLRKGVYIADDIDTPFVMGIFRPRIYLPGTLDSTEQKYIIAHERHHIRRGDHIFKALGFLALTIHWFNPFVWVAFVLAGRDMEMSCDEAVIRKLGEDVRAEYSASLLNLATGKRLFAGTPLAFDEGDPTERVRNLAKWRKPAFWVVIICIIVCTVLAVCLLTDPQIPEPKLTTTFLDLDTNNVTDIILRNDHNGETTFISDKQSIDEICSIIKSIGGINGFGGRHHYEGSYSLTLKDGSEEIFSIQFGDTDAFFYGIDDDGYAIRYELQGLSIDGIIRLLSPYDTSGFHWPILDQTEKTSAFSVTMTARDQTQSSVELVFALEDADEEGTVWFGENYRIYLWDNNQWVELAVADAERPPEPAAEEHLTQITPGQPVYQTIDWYENYGNLPAGKYRIQMLVSLQKEGEFPDEKPVYAEFSLSDYQNWAVSTQVHEVTPESLVLTYHNELDDPIWRLPGYTIQSWLDGYWVDLDVGKTWHETMELVDFDHQSNPQNGMFIQWDGIGILPEGNYLIGQEFCTDADPTKGHRFTVYASFEITGDSGGIKPLESLPELYSGEQAMIDGCLVTRDGEVSENLDVLMDFVETTSRGEPGFIRIVNWYYGEESYYTAEDLTFDGSKYILEWIEDGRRQSRSYRYLKHFSGEKERENMAYDAYEHYVLVNDNSISWQQIWEGLISSQYGAAIDHWTICSDYIYYTKHPDLPDNPDYAILELKGSGLVTITNSERLEKLIYLFENAEILGYEPKTHSVGVDLNLIFTTRDQDFIIELDPDSDICRINGEYVWYGRPDEPEYTYKLWEYLGITQWPDIVYMVCENALKP